MCIYSSYDEEISTSEIKTIRVSSISNDFELPNDILYNFHKIKNVSSCIHSFFVHKYSSFVQAPSIDVLSIVIKPEAVFYSRYL